jgi:hypothetical protein
MAAAALAQLEPEHDAVSPSESVCQYMVTASGEILIRKAVGNRFMGRPHTPTNNKHPEGLMGGACPALDKCGGDEAS